ncbi:MAG: hypothetical protein K2Q20_12765, partial [Phycisphaerales bacterium]|nr:hypothetical protein [Phycisphaerales bacterium]
LTTTAGACCDSITGQCVIVFQGSCNIGPWLANTTCESLPCTVPVGACCNNGSGACTLVESAFCGRNGGTFVGGTVCDITACPGTGACCNSVSGACTVVFETACAGTWVSGGTCNNPCPGAGACCNSTTGFCSVVLSTSCSAGTFTPGALCSAPCAGVGTQVPQPVFNGPAVAPLSSPVVVTGPGTVQSVDVWVNLSTTRVNDARLSLVAPNGQTLPLLVRVGSKPPFCTTTPVGGSSGQLGGLGYSAVSGTLIFQDSAPTDIYTGIATGAAAGGGRFKAASCGGTIVSLNAPAPAGFGGLNIAGTWTLVAADESANSTITISSWGVSFNGGKPEPCTIGRCQTGPTCTSTTFVQCTGGSWSIGACTPTCTTGTPGACCYQTSCSVVCASQCPAGASFAGSGTTCSASTCLVRCCLADGSCRLTAPTACVGVAGPLGSTCSPNTCTQPGTCCGPNGSCSLLLAGACTASGGTAGAPGSACSPSVCATLPAPINDRCIDVAGAAGGGQPFDIILSNPINGTWNSLTVGAPSTIAGATGDGVNSSCDAQEAGQDVWYRFLAGASGLHTFSLCSTPSAQRWDSTISVWTACGTQVSGLCADDTCTTGNSGVLGHATLQAALTQGVTYLIRVGAYRPVTTAQGAFTLLTTAQTDQGDDLRGERLRGADLLPRDHVRPDPDGPVRHWRSGGRRAGLGRRGDRLPRAGGAADGLLLRRLQQKRGQGCGRHLRVLERLVRQLV